jgi:hypothetical protein
VPCSTFQVPYLLDLCLVRLAAVYALNVEYQDEEGFVTGRGILAETCVCSCV